MNKPFPTTALAICLLAATLPVQAQVKSTPDRLGNALQYVVPAGAVALSLYHEDTQGLKELAYTFALSQGSTEILKHTVRSRRPDGTGLGFPSGHTSAVFASAGYVHQRYGVMQAIPFYGLATLAAYSRVHSHHHFTKDVVGGALIGVASSMLLTHPLGPRSTASIGYGPEGMSLQFATTW